MKNHESLHTDELLDDAQESYWCPSCKYDAEDWTDLQNQVVEIRKIITAMKLMEKLFTSQELIGAETSS